MSCLQHCSFKSLDFIYYHDFENSVLPNLKSDKNICVALIIGVNCDMDSYLKQRYNCFYSIVLVATAKVH